MEVYIKINDHQFYKITDGKAQAINTIKNTFKSLVSLPSSCVQFVKVSNKDEFENAKKSIGL